MTASAGVRAEQERGFGRRLGATALALGVALGLSAGVAIADEGPVTNQTEAAAPPTGLEIAERINARDDGTTMTSRIVMDLIARSGSVRTRETRFFRRYGEGEKWIVLFYESPTNIKDTAFLTHDFLDPAVDDEQWLYLPALRRSRRIALRDRGKSFLGTDLSYEDVKNETKVSIADYTWQADGEEEVDGAPCLVVEATPVDEDTAWSLGYGRVRLRVDPEIWMVRLADYWEPTGRHLKTSRVGELRQVGGYWTPHRVEVANHRTGHRTVFRYEDVRHDLELPEDLFTERAMRRGPPTIR